MSVQFGDSSFKCWQFQSQHQWPQHPKHTTYTYTVTRPGLLLRARHSASLSSQQPPADCWRTCTPLSTLYKHHDAAGAVNMTFFPRQPGISGGGSTSLEQFEPVTRAANSLLQFRRETKAHLFWLSFFDWSQAIATFYELLTVWLRSVQHTLCINSVHKVPLQRPWCDSVTLIFAFLIIIIIII